MHKVSWPTWKELQSSSIVVMVATLVSSLIIFMMDLVFGVHNMANQNFWKGILGFIYKFMGQ